MPAKARQRRGLSRRAAAPKSRKAPPRALRQALGGTFHPDPERSFNLAAPYYHRAEVYEREKEAIFYRTWQYVGHVGQVREPGDYVTGTIMDEGVFVIRGKDRTLRAFSNVCRHRAHRLLQGRGNVKVIVCPYHAWSYEIDGRLRHARATEKMRDFDPSGICLPAVQVEEFCGFLFVNLDPTAPSLKRQSGELETEIRRYMPELDKLALRRKLVHEVKANWKVAVDNFLECYHCHIVHPALVDLHDMTTYRSKTHGIYSSHIALSRSGDNKAYKFECKSDEDIGFAGWWIWPNTTLGVYAGEGNVVVNYFVLRGPECTDAVFDIYYTSEEETSQQREAIEYFDKVLQPEDTRVCEGAQTGLRSRSYLQSRYVVDPERSYISEHPLHHFHGLYLRAMEDLRA